MASPADERNAQSARVHIHAAESAPWRKDLELTQATNFAWRITDTALRLKVQTEIRTARQR